MNIRFCSPAILALALVSCSGGGADTDGDGEITTDEVAAEVKNIQFQAGEWETTVEFVDITFDETKLPPEAKKFMVPIMESMKGQSLTDSKCMTEEEAKNPQEEFFNAQEDQECTYDKFSLSGGSIDMAMQCTGSNGDGGTVTATGSYTATSYDLDMAIATKGGQQGDVNITAKSTAKRIGECKS